MINNKSSPKNNYKNSENIIASRIIPNSSRVATNWKFSFEFTIRVMNKTKNSKFNSAKYSKRKIIIIIDSSWAEDFKHLEYKYKEAVPTYFRKTTSSKYLNNGSV